MCPSAVHLVWIWLLLAGTVVGFADDKRPFVPYQASIEGVKDGTLETLLEAQSVALTLADRPPASLAQLRHRVEGDRDRFMNLMESLGHLQSEVTIQVDTNATPVHVRFKVLPGPRYRLGEVRVEVMGENPPSAEPLPDAFKSGTPLLAAAVLKAEAAVLQTLGNRGYPFARIERRGVAVNHESRQLSLDYLVDPGAPMVFGEFSVTGLSKVRESFVHRYVDWKPGEVFHQDKVDRMEDRLRATGLFATAQVRDSQPLEDSATLPVAVELKERRHRTVKLGASYETDIGPGLQAGWQHRNLFHRGESLTFDAKFSSVELSQTAEFKRQHFLDPDLSLLLSERLARDDPDAYISTSLQGSIILQYQLSGTNRIVAAGTSYKYSEVEQLDEFGIYRQLLFPMAFMDDRRDNALNPMHGTYLMVWSSPYINTMERDLSFLKTSMEGRGYLRVFRDPALVAALRLQVGGINGADRDDIAPDDRFYAGGGGSIRGYDYQEVGDQVDGTPIGGTSILEGSLELRFRADQTLGWVAFVDGGSVFDTAWPTFEQDIQFGAGLGVRYATGFGPIRFDLALPVNPKEDDDQDIHIYISIGQAF